MKTWELQDLLDLMIEKHAISVKMGGLEVTLHPSAFTQVVTDQPQTTPLTDEPSEDEILYASSPYYDVLKNQRKEVK